MAFQPITIADVAAGARLYGLEDQAMLRLCLQLIDDFREPETADPARLLDNVPEPTGDPRWDAFLAGLAAHLAYHAGLPVPSWTGDANRFLKRWWFVSDLPSVRAAALAESPAAFRLRGVFVTPDLFARG